MKYLLILLTLLASPAIAQPLSGAASPAPVERVYAKPSAQNMLKAMLRAGALDAMDPAAQEDYLLLNECQIYIDTYRDDFKFNRLHKATVQVIARDRAGWPDAFLFVSPLQLDRYDFINNTFKLAEKSQLKNVNSFALMNIAKDVCLQGQGLQRLPGAVSVRIDQPVTVASLPINQQQGRNLLARMEAAGNETRQIYARFKIAISYMPPVADKEVKSSSSKYVFDGTLAAIEFFEDAELTKPIWTFVKN